MPRPVDLKTKIFLDSGDPKETKQIVEMMGFLDGQTTNPTLISKNPEAQARLQTGQLFSAEEALGLYKDVVQQIAKVIPDGAISIEVYADENSTTEELLTQADEFSSWIKHPHIKFPITQAGLSAAEQAVVDGMNVNMTLCFSQDQAAAVFAATRGAKPGQVFLSPFIGRLDDIGYNGLDVVQHILSMYASTDHHVQVLAASIRTVDHLIRSLQLEADYVTVPFGVLTEWINLGYPMTAAQSDDPEPKLLHAIDFVDIDLSKPWQEYNLEHQLTAKGLAKFVDDWNSLIKA